MSATGPRAASEGAPTLVGDIQALMGVPTITISTAAIEQTLSGEESDLLSMELRRALLSWIDGVELLNRQTDYLERTNNEFSVSLVGRYPTRNLFTEFGRESLFSFDPGSLLRDIRFESVVHSRGDASVLLLDQVGHLTEVGREIVSLIALAQG